MRRREDVSTPDLFEVPSPTAPTAGGLNVDTQLRHKLSELLKASPLSRFEVAARMSELTGQEVTKHQLDGWTAESHEGWRFPLAYAPAFEVALETHELIGWYGSVRGCKVLVGKDALLAELGKIERAKQDLAQREKSVKRLLGEAGR